MESVEELAASAHLQDSAPNMQVVKYLSETKIKNLKREVRYIRAQAGADDEETRRRQDRDFWGFVFDGCYQLRGHHEIHEVKDKIITDARALDPEAFRWRFTEAEFGVLAHAVMVYVLNTVADDPSTRAGVEAKLKRSGNPLRITDFLKEYHK